MSVDVYQIGSTENGALDLACQRALPYLAAARAAGTRDVYRRAWQRWAKWCATMHAAPLQATPQTVAAYLAELAREGKSVASIKGALAAIVHVHRAEGDGTLGQQPAITSVMAGITRRSSRPIKRAAALKLDDLRTILADIDGHDLRALRDRALLLIGFFAALRRSELVALDVRCRAVGGQGSGRSSVDIQPEGLLVYLSGTKASAMTQTVAIPRRDDALCATRALETYMAAAGISYGALFRPVSKSGRLLARRLEATGVRHILAQRAAGEGFSPHSLRAGFITSAAEAAVPEHVIQRTSRHKSIEALRCYIRAGDPFNCAARHF